MLGVLLVATASALFMFWLEVVLGFRPVSRLFKVDQGFNSPSILSSVFFAIGSSSS